MTAKCFDNGKLYINDTCIDVEQLEWNAHPTFKGVSLKHVIKGESTDGMVSYHLVKVEPGCEIKIHNHPGKTEVHEVVDGSGYCMLDDKKLDYHVGTVGFIPADIYHSVRAGSEGLFLFAKFFPALL